MTRNDTSGGRGWGRWLLAAGLLAGLLAAATPPLLGATRAAEQDVVFSDGFESGDGSAWTAKAGADSYPSGDQCHTGRYCGAMTLRGGKDQQSALWEAAYRNAGEVAYASAWWRFPVGYSWDKAPGPASSDHKLMIFNTANNVGRFHVNLRGGGNSPVLAIIGERIDMNEWAYGNETHWPTDGGWHQLEIEFRRVSGTGARARLWFDGRLVVDHAGRVCGDPCSPLVNTQFGAYVNQGAARTQTFYVDDARITRSPRDAANPNPPRPTATRTRDPVPTASPTRTPGPRPTGSPTSPPGNPCAGNQPSILFCDGFESRGFSAYGDVHSTAVFRFVDSPVVAGRTALQARIPGGALGEDFANAFVADHPLRRGGPGAQANEVYLRAKVHYSPGFDMSAGKLFIVNAFESWNAPYPGPNSYAPFYVSVQNINGEMEALLHSKTTGRSVWRPMRQNQGTPVRFQTDRWYEIGMHLKLNTPGRADGVTELFIDGRRVARYTDVNLRDRYTRVGWNHLMISPLQAKAVNATRSIHYDEVVLSTTPLPGVTS